MVLAHLFGLRPFTGEGDSRIIDPDIVLNIGHGSASAGRRVLEKFVARVRREARDYVVEQPDGNHGRVRQRFGTGGTVVRWNPPAANENRNLQIPDDPYTMAIINRQWDEMVKAGNKPVLKVVPEE